MTTPTDNSTKFEFDADIEGERIDTFIVRMLKENSLVLSRSKVQHLITDGCAFVNERQRKKNFVLSEGDKVEFNLPAEKPSIVKGEQIEFDILHEDDDLIIVCKPA